MFGRVYIHIGKQRDFYTAILFIVLNDLMLYSMWRAKLPLEISYLYKTIRDVTTCANRAFHGH